MKNRLENSVALQKNELISFNCCLTKDNSSISPSRLRIYSQPKKSKQKKIAITMHQRGHSNGKQTNSINSTGYKQKIIIKENVSTNKIINNRKQLQIGSKDIPFQGLIKNSQAYQRQDKTLRISQAQSKFQSLSTGNTMQYFEEYQEANQIIQSHPLNMPIISEVEITYEQFISQGSSVIRLVNNLNKVQEKENIRNQQINQISQNINNKQICNINSISPKNPFKFQSYLSNPIERIMDRKKIDRIIQGPKKRLVL